MEENKFYEPKQEYKVLCNCITYNQAQYITDTMNGFTMQDTTFPFVCSIIDDASTDGEPEVIKTYLKDHFDMANAEYIEIETANIVVAKHKENENCTFVVYFLKRNLWKEQELKYEHIKPWRDHCEYEALCEGDDYWISNTKLQLQVDYLETNIDCQYVFTARYVDNEIEQTRTEQRYKKRLYTTHDILSGFNPGIQNVCYRTTLVHEFTKFNGINGDRLYPYCASLKGKIEYIDEITSVYRVTGNGISTSVKKEDWFVHAANDFLNFHENTNSKDHAAYIEGMAIYVGSVGIPKWQLYRYPSVIYKSIKEINPEIRYIDCLNMVILFVKNAIYRRIGLSDKSVRKIKKVIRADCNFEK